MSSQGGQSGASGWDCGFPGLPGIQICGWSRVLSCWRLLWFGTVSALQSLRCSSPSLFVLWLMVAAVLRLTVVVAATAAVAAATAAIALRSLSWKMSDKGRNGLQPPSEQSNE